MGVTFLDFFNLLEKGGWVFLTVLLFLLWKNLWLDYVRLKYSANIKWITLAIRIPQVVDKTPKSMEQIFSGLYSMRSGVNLVEKWIDGKHQMPISLDIASLGGAVNFFIRTPEAYRMLIESQFYAQYPEADIDEVEDYTDKMPNSIPNEEYDLWGGELKLTKKDAYPIRTYKNFKEEVEIGTEGKDTTKKFIDPIASLMEVMIKIKEGEQIWINYLIKPADPKWQNEGRDLIDELLGKKKKKSSSNVIEEVFQFFSDLVWIFFGRSPQNKSKEVQTKEDKTEITPDKLTVIKAIEENISKHGFYVNIKVAYIAKRSVFSMVNVPAILGTFNQFSTFNLNGFIPDGKTTPGIDYFFPEQRNKIRKMKLYQSIKKKRFREKVMVLNVEELATVYHIPSSLVEAPTLPKVESKKVQPPTALPVM